MGAHICIDGQAVIEAEDFDLSVLRSSHEWGVISDANAVGGLAVQALPDDGTSISTDPAANAPELQYRVAFDQAGTYRVWQRALAISSGNTDHIGLDGVVPSAGLNLAKTVDSTFGWFDDGCLLEVPDAAEHIVNLYMREDGFAVDRLIVTKDMDLTPTGDGPPATGRHSSEAPPGTVILQAEDRDGFVLRERARAAEDRVDADALAAIEARVRARADEADADADAMEAYPVQ